MDLFDLWLDLEHRACAGSLDFGKEGFPSVSRYYAIFTCLQRNESVRQYIGSGGEVICGEEDAVVVDLRLVEEPPTPALCKGIFVVKLDWYFRCIVRLLAGLEIAIQDFHACRDIVLDHDIVRVVRQDESQLGGNGLIRSKSQCRNRC